MKMEKISSALYGDMYHATMPDGLHVWVYPDQSAATAYALLDTKVGSVDDMLPGPKGPKQIPGGVAHFLEHKMFETPEGDVFYQFGRQGADANAYTSFDDTCYLFSCTEQFEQNLTTLLQQVKTGYFTPENVEKEKGIIGQEIRMYDDDAEWQSTFLLLKSLYHSTSITEDIAGTVDSIQQIDADLLNQVFAQYYTPGNQCLAVAGRVDPDKVFDICLAHHSGGVTAPPSRCQIVEPKEIVTPCTTRQLPVAVPLACLGFKEQVQGDMSY